ncbi:hypothetical protein SAMN05216481_108171 [Streptomyces radiopugnans]|uniref:Uncharacterized protein n=1 Tax=Streptomyces radiopugnans TaxID=403935 RepID=A0A1H9G9T0_9ACTN|nr:hypothetical protein SAMN05216481_108171 [Streptomyces radiopugnans]
MTSICERKDSPVKTTVSSRGPPRCVAAVKPPAGSAETRQAPLPPNRMDARPPVVWKVRTSAPAVWQPSSPPVFAEGDGVGRAAGRAVGEAAGFGGGAGEEARRVGEGVGEGVGDLLGSALAVGEETTVPGVSRATGGVGRVVPTTNWTVRLTVVTLRDVHDSHSST